MSGCSARCSSLRASLVWNGTVLLPFGVSATDRIPLHQDGVNYAEAFIAGKPHFIDAQSQEELADSSWRQFLEKGGHDP